MSVSLAMEALHDGVERLVQQRQVQREAKDWTAADATRRALECIRVGTYRVQLNDGKDAGTWHWSVGG